MNDVDYFFQWGIDNFNEVIDRIESGETKKLVLFGPEEHEFPSFFHDRRRFNIFKGYLKEKDVELVLISGGVNDTALNSIYYLAGAEGLHSWPTFFLHHTLWSNLANSRKPLGHNKVIEKHFTSLNGRAHPWRCLFIDHMYKENLFDNGFISWHNSDNWHLNDYYKFQWWKPKNISCDTHWDLISRTTGQQDLSKAPDVFKRSLFSIISESNTKCVFITEKTWVPIYNQRPFLIYGAPNTHLYLEQLGFKMFDEIIDYSFDKEPDDDIRAQMFMHEVKKMTLHDIGYLKSILHPKVMHNYRNMFDVAANTNAIHPEIHSAINDGSHESFEVYKEVLNILNIANFRKFKLIGKHI
jgi:hypothetical protein